MPDMEHFDDVFLFDRVMRPFIAFVLDRRHGRLDPQTCSSARSIRTKSAKLIGALVR